MIPRYKIVVLVHIGQLCDQSMQISSRCLWDSTNDTFATYSFKNSSLFGVGTVYAVYYEWITKAMNGLRREHVTYFSYAFLTIKKNVVKLCSIDFYRYFLECAKNNKTRICDPISWLLFLILTSIEPASSEQYPKRHFNLIVDFFLWCSSQQSMDRSLLWQPLSQHIDMRAWFWSRQWRSTSFISLPPAKRY